MPIILLILLAGNDYGTKVSEGRDDASYGCFLRGNHDKSFTAVPARDSGFTVKGDVRDLSLLNLPGGEKIILAGVNNDSLRLFRISGLWKPR